MNVITSEWLKIEPMERFMLIYHKARKQHFERENARLQSDA